MSEKLIRKQEIGGGIIKSDVSLFSDILKGYKTSNSSIENRIICVEAALTLLATGYIPETTDKSPLHEITHWIEDSLNMGNNVPVQPGHYDITTSIPADE